jgi:hypothetical protein
MASEHNKDGLWIAEQQAKRGQSLEIFGGTTLARLSQ